MKVLLIVDLQNDFCPGGSLGVGGGHDIVPGVNRLAAEGDYDVVVASMDWHPEGHKSFASSHPGKRAFEKIMFRGKEQTLWPDHCVQGTPGAELHPDLNRARIDHIIRKGSDLEVDSNSAFRDNAQDRETGLRALLVQLAKDRGEALEDIVIDVCGIALEVCDRLTGYDAVSYGFRTRFISDLTPAIDPRPESIAQVHADLRERGIEIIPSERVLPRVRPLVMDEEQRPVCRPMSVGV